MLVLGRKTEQSILIGDDIKVTVIDVQGKLVKLGIEAPKHMTVLREELKTEGAGRAAKDNAASDAETSQEYAG